jgi:hypothetical protein
MPDGAPPPVDTVRVIHADDSARPRGCYEFTVLSGSAIPSLARTLDLGSLLAEVSRRYGAYDLAAHLRTPSTRLSRGSDNMANG